MIKDPGLKLPFLQIWSFGKSVIRKRSVCQAEQQPRTMKSNLDRKNVPIFQTYKSIYILKILIYADSRTTSFGFNPQLWQPTLVHTYLCIMSSPASAFPWIPWYSRNSASNAFRGNDASFSSSSCRNATCCCCCCCCCFPPPDPSTMDRANWTFPISTSFSPNAWKWDKKKDAKTCVFVMKNTRILG